jgi:hypothetical protein
MAGAIGMQLRAPNKIDMLEIGDGSHTDLYPS